MGLLARLRAWWRRRPWSGSDPAGGTGTGARETPGAGYECAVCGTGVDDPDGPCPLCQGTDVVPAAGGVAGGADGTGGDAGGTAGAAAVDRRPGTAADDASVERLRTLREDGDLLERHADRWRPVDGGFRVETADGTREVDSREEVVALLRAVDG